MSIGQVNEGELEQRLGLVEMARSWSPRVISKLENATRSYLDDDLYWTVLVSPQCGCISSESVGVHPPKVRLARRYRQSARVFGGL
jgi:hypothetical protein